MLLVGDSGGMVNPFNGEGIAYAMESGELAAEVAVQALARPGRRRPGAGAAAYPNELKARYGGYYRLGGIFVKLIGKPEMMRSHPARHAAPDPDAVRAQAAGQPHRPAGRRRDGPGHQRDDGWPRRSDAHRATTAVQRTPDSVNRDSATEGREGRAGEHVALGVRAHRRAVRPGRGVRAVLASPSRGWSGPRRYNRAKLEAYECGIEPTPQPVGGGRFPVKFYLTAMLFIIFDIEIIFLYPWAVAFDRWRSFGFVEMVLFIVHRVHRVRLRVAARRPGLGLREVAMGMEEKVPPASC